MNKLKIFRLLMLSGFLAGAQEMEIPQVTIHCTGNTGKFFRNYPVPPGTRFSVRKTEAGELRKLLKNGTLRLAVTTEPLTGKDLKTEKLGYSAVILAIHPAGRLRNISSAHARSILEKNYGSWRLLGGPSARIHLYVKANPELPPPAMNHEHRHDGSRPAAMPAPEPLGAELMSKNQPLPTIQYSRPLVIRTESDSKSFSMLCTDIYGMACFDITRFDETRVRLLAVDNIPPTLENFRAGSYPLVTIYYLITPDSPAPAEHSLIRFIRSGKFAKQLYRNGILPEMPDRNLK